jgi:hypothetical protein
VPAKPLAAFYSPSRYARFDAPAMQKPPAALVVTAFVGLQLLRSLPGPSPRSLYRLDAVDQLLEDLRVEDLGPGEHRDERRTFPVDEQVTFRARIPCQAKWRRMRRLL